MALTMATRTVLTGKNFRITVAGSGSALATTTITAMKNSFLNVRLSIFQPLSKEAILHNCLKTREKA